MRNCLLWCCQEGSIRPCLVIIVVPYSLPHQSQSPLTLTSSSRTHPCTRQLCLLMLMVVIPGSRTQSSYCWAVDHDYDEAQAEAEAELNIRHCRALILIIATSRGMIPVKLSTATMFYSSMRNLVSRHKMSDAELISSIPLLTSSRVASDVAVCEGCDSIGKDWYNRVPDLDDDTCPTRTAAAAAATAAAGTTLAICYSHKSTQGDSIGRQVRSHNEDESLYNIIMRGLSIIPIVWLI